MNRRTHAPAPDDISAACVSCERFAAALGHTAGFLLKCRSPGKDTVPFLYFGKPITDGGIYGTNVARTIDRIGDIYGLNIRAVTDVENWEESQGFNYADDYWGLENRVVVVIDDSPPPKRTEYSPTTLSCAAGRMKLDRNELRELVAKALYIAGRRGELEYVGFRVKKGKLFRIVRWYGNTFLYPVPPAENADATSSNTGNDRRNKSSVQRKPVFDFDETAVRKGVWMITDYLDENKEYLEGYDTYMSDINKAYADKETIDGT